MALKTLMLKHKLDSLRASLAALAEKDTEFATREAEIENAIAEAATEDEQTAVDAAIEQFDADKDAHNQEKEKLSAGISELEAQLNEAEQQQTPPPTIGERTKNTQKKERETHMNIEQRYREFTGEQRAAFVAREDVHDFLERFRALGNQTRGVTGADLTIPDTMLGLIRSEVASGSKLLRFVRVVNVSGIARQNIMGTIPEAIWTEMCAKINELEFGFNQVTVDGYKVGGYIAICNATLEDSDANLVGEIISMIGAAIAKALDKAILFGTGTKMPTGIATRLAQAAKPTTWNERAPEWTDLRITNLLKLSANTTSGVEFFAELIQALAIAKPVYSSEGLFWVMNRKTHLDLITKALTFNASGALVAGASNTMPIIGGTIVEFEDDEIADHEIIGGFGGNYLLSQRHGVTFGQSEHVYFLEEQTVFKGTARYDGTPLAGEAFVIVNYANVAPTTTNTFPIDYANTDMNLLGITAAAGTTTGNTVLTITGAVGSNPTYKYKAKATADGIEVGDTVNTTWKSLTSGTTQVSATAGTMIAVVELDAAGRVVSVGEVASVPHTA